MTIGVDIVQVLGVVSEIWFSLFQLKGKWVFISKKKRWEIRFLVRVVLKYILCACRQQQKIPKKLAKG